MFSKTVRAAVFATFASITAIGAYAYLSPASDAAVSIPDRLDLPVNPALSPWSDELSAEAVDAAGIELDLDGNASALYPSDRL